MWRIAIWLRLHGSYQITRGITAVGKIHLCKTTVYRDPVNLADHHRVRIQGYAALSVLIHTRHLQLSMQHLEIAVFPYCIFLANLLSTPHLKTKHFRTTACLICCNFAALKEEQALSHCSILVIICKPKPGAEHRSVMEPFLAFNNVYGCKIHTRIQPC